MYKRAAIVLGIETASITKKQGQGLFVFIQEENQFIPLTKSGGHSYNYSHFIDREIEAQED